MRDKTKQTAVEWLIQELKKTGVGKNLLEQEYNKNITKQAKMLEKQQIIDAYNNGDLRSADLYYDETYGSKGSDDHIADTNEMVSSQTEISDEEIKKGNNQYIKDKTVFWGIQYTLNDGSKKFQSNEYTKKESFKKWEDAVPFLGKEVSVSLVELPNVIGVLKGISLVYNGDKIINALLEVDNGKWEFWKCRPNI